MKVQTNTPHPRIWGRDYNEEY